MLGFEGPVTTVKGTKIVKDGKGNEDEIKIVWIIGADALTDQPKRIAFTGDQLVNHRAAAAGRINANIATEGDEALLRLCSDALRKIDDPRAQHLPMPNL